MKRRLAVIAILHFYLMVSSFSTFFFFSFEKKPIESWPVKLIGSTKA